MVRKLSIVVATVAMLAGSSFPSANAATKTVEIPGPFFQPEQLKIVVGDTVRWVNEDNQRHSVSANTSAQAQGEFFDSGTRCPGGLLGTNCLRPGESYTHTFNTIGTFTYRCRIHGSDTSFSSCAMCGQIVVRAKTTPAPPSTAPATPSTKSPTVSASPSVSVSPTATASGSSPIAGGPPPSDDSFPVLPVAAAAVVLLAGSGFLVYRSLLRS